MKRLYKLLTKTLFVLMLFSLESVISADAVPQIPQITAQTPFTGTPIPIPGIIEMENFDNGIEGEAYHDTDEANYGGAFRTDTGVDVEISSENQFNIGYIYEDEWTEYSVNILSDGIYQIEARVASEGNGGTFNFQVDNVNVTGDMTVPVTGGWQTWTTIKSNQFNLSKGQRILKFYATSSGYNINYINVKRLINTIPPTVALLTPENDASFRVGDEIIFTAEAIDTDGQVVKVEYFANDVKIGQAVTSPWTFNWTDYTVGDWTIYALAEDDAGAATKSESIDIKIKRPKLEKAPIFSHVHGFYNSAFDLSISSEIENAAILYTLDGSDPLTSANAKSGASPLTVRIDPNSAAGRDKTPCVIVRAVSTINSNQASDETCNTYIFLDKVKTQINPGGNWPGNYVNDQELDFAMDPDVVNSSKYKNQIDDAMLAIPSICINTEIENLFDAETGIYVNALMHGTEWERPASLELINPDGTEGFQINCGIRIRGGWSRHGYNPKHAFRVFFRDDEYGAGKLKYPLFGDEGVDEFDKIDFRTSQNYSWSYTDGYACTMNRDVYSRDVQREMGQPYTRSRYYHLYLNGMYWGLFQSQERPSASFGESYLGGTADDYDVVKTDIETFTYDIEATDGNLDAWEEIWNACQTGFLANAQYFALEGRNSDGTKDPAGKVLVDIDNLIDYMLIIFYTGNIDSPTTKFRGNDFPNNFFAIYNRNRNEGFKFFAHDAEHTLMTDPTSLSIGMEENRVNIGSLSNDERMEVWGFNNFHPQWLHFKLTDNTEYRLRFADHAYKHFYNNGVLTPDKADAIFQKRVAELDKPIIAESARWGDSKNWTAYTKDDNWLPVVERIKEVFFPERPYIVLEQLIDEDLFPDIEPPLFVHDNTDLETTSIAVQAGFIVKIENPNTKGQMIYTTNGVDPRIVGGTVAAGAVTIASATNITVNTSTTIKARVKNGSTWSALHEINFLVNENLNALKMTELHYHPLDEGAIDDREFEFIELKNTGTTALNLTNAAFVNGIVYTFPGESSIAPGGFYVIASNEIEFKNRYGFSPNGDYEGQLDNGGEKVVMVNATGDTIISVRYNDKAPWPVLPDSLGHSLVSAETNPTGNPDEASYWRASHSVHGSPGTDDLATSVENMTHIPETFGLKQNYPNPFNPETVIEFSIVQAGNVSIKIFDILGQKVATITNQKYLPGFYKIVWKPENISGGVYFCSLESNGSRSIKKMVYIK